MVKRVTKWQAEDDSLFDSESDAKKHDVGEDSHKCPVCNGLGHLRGKEILEKVMDHESMGYGGQFAAPVYIDVVKGYEKDICKPCKGAGWTKNKLKPIIREEIIGYE